MNIKTTQAIIDNMRPVRSAPISRACDICKEESVDPPAQAVTDAPTKYGSWGYLCLKHTAEHAPDGFHRVGMRLLAQPTAQADFIDVPGAALLTEPSVYPTYRVFHSTQADVALTYGWYRQMNRSNVFIGPFSTEAAACNLSLQPSVPKTPDDSPLPLLNPDLTNE